METLPYLSVLGVTCQEVVASILTEITTKKKKKSSPLLDIEGGGGGGGVSFHHIHVASLSSCKVPLEGEMTKLPQIRIFQAVDAFSSTSQTSLSFLNHLSQSSDFQ